MSAVATLVPVRDDAAAVVARVDFGDLKQNGGEWIWRRCLPPGVYELEILDKWGDGMCCFWGRGEWHTTLDGVMIASGETATHDAGVSTRIEARVPVDASVAPSPPSPAARHRRRPPVAATRLRRRRRRLRGSSQTAGRSCARSRAALSLSA